MLKKLLLIFLMALCSIPTDSFAQDTAATPNSLNSGTIASQFEYIYRVSNGFQEYEVVKKSHLERLKANITDSLRVLRKEVADLKTMQSSWSDSVLSISQQLEQANLEKEVAMEEKDSFSFLGMPIQKSVYSSIMWVLVAGLGAALSFFSVQYFRSFGRIKKAQKDLEEVQEEFDQHRKNALERERKLKRELIDAQMGKN